MAKTKTETTTAPDAISDLEARIVLAARERAHHFGLSAKDAAAELTEATRLARAVGEQLRAEQAARGGRT